MSKISHNFVSAKINKVRWQIDSKEKFHHEAPTVFAAGSWDNAENNKVTFWEYNDKRNFENGAEPKLLAQKRHFGDVTDLNFLTPTTFATSSSNGSINLYSWDPNTKEISDDHSWKKVHRSYCTGIAVKEDEICSIGEDGRIAQINLKDKSIKYIEKNNSCSLSAISYLRHHEIITGNTRGFLKLWDLRQDISNFQLPTALSSEQNTITTIAIHPSQFHIVASGGEDGMLYLWDMRKFLQPVSVVNGHPSPISELKFHPTHPNHLFTCSHDGGVWHWNVNRSNRSNNVFSYEEQVRSDSQTNPWLLHDLTNSQLQILSLSSNLCLPINSLDIAESTLICGSDNEAICVISDIAL